SIVDVVARRRDLVEQAVDRHLRSRRLGECRRGQESEDGDKACDYCDCPSHALPPQVVVRFLYVVAQGDITNRSRDYGQRDGFTPAGEITSRKNYHSARLVSPLPLVFSGVPPPPGRRGFPGPVPGPGGRRPGPPGPGSRPSGPAPGCSSQPGAWGRG